MEYAVKLTRRAERDLQYLFGYLSVPKSSSARRWFNGLEKAITGLTRSPRRCPRAPEAAAAGHPLRHLLYGRKPNVYRVLFEIEEKRKTVLILTIRHGARNEWEGEESK
jgi:plasmid stabilization system protein ParE